MPSSHSFVRHAVLAALAALFLCGPPVSEASAAAAPVTITNHTDSSQALGWGLRSHWKQPWRSYLDTVPATTLLDAIGINFNVNPAQAASTAELLGDSGFRRARIEVGWGTINYDDPSRMNAYERGNLETTLNALKANGIRPLILLNSNSTMPCPMRLDSIALSAPAGVGASVVQIDPADVGKVIPGRSGITANGIAAQYLFTSVEADGTAHLSRPLLAALPAGEVKMATLLYAPFRDAVLADGTPNPAFEATMAGWLNYVDVVTQEVKAILGSDRFDVEVWNELSFGSAFLNINRYYKPGPDWKGGYNQTYILQRTVDLLRDPAKGLEAVGIGDGFAAERPWENGSQSPLGLTAIDKHPYHGWDSFPAKAQVNGNRPLNGLGQLAGSLDVLRQWTEVFTPTYDAFFPEYFLSGIQTETLIRDLAPYPTSIFGFEHGRNSHPEGGPPPQVWVTEVNLNPAAGPTPGMSPADVRHVATKDVLRYLSAFVNKGVTAIDFYAVKAGDLSLVDSGFFDALDSSPDYPGDAAGGETTDAVRRYVAAMRGAVPILSPRSLSLRALTDYDGNVQFKGNGSAAYPPLYDRDVFAFFPFQVDQHRFVIPLYVMTRNVAKIYDGSGPSRFDLPPERYRMAVGGVDGEGAEVSATDPLTGRDVPVKVVSASNGEVVVEMEATDSPRLLTIQEYVPPGRSPADDKPAARKPAAKREPEPKGEAPALRLKPGDKRRLLRRRRLFLNVACDAPCTLRFHGRLKVGTRGFPMRLLSQGRGGDERGPVTARMSISRHAARFARRARDAGSTLGAIVIVSGTGDSGDTSISRRRLVLVR